MRYNIKRLFNEVVTYENDLKKLLEGTHNISKALPKKSIQYEINSRRHAISLCQKLIGQEVVSRWKEGKNLNSEVGEEVPLIKFI